MSNKDTGWSPRVCWLEGLRNLRSGGLRTILLVTGLSLLFAAAATLDGKAVSDVAERAREYQQRGGYVLIVRARLTADDTAASLNAADCHALNSSPGVIASGVVSGLGRTSLTGAPSAPLSIFETTPEGFRALTGVAAVGAPPTNTAEQLLAVSRLVADEYGLEFGRRITTTGSVSGVVSDVVEPRSTSATRSILNFTKPTNEGEACWIETDPASYDAWLATASAAFDTTDAVAYSQRFADAGSSFTRYNPSRDLRDRQTRTLPVVVGVIGALITSFGLWMRRSVVGMYRAMSLPLQTVIWIQAAEVFMSIWLAFLLAVSWSALILAIAGEPTWPVLAFAFRSSSGAVAVCGLGSLIGIFLLTRGSVMDQLKDR